MLAFLLVSILAVESALCSQLLQLSKQNQCIKSIVYEFISSSTCQKLDQTTKSKLAFRMTNCLFLQMGKPQVQCDDPRKCRLEGDSWNTFTTFFTHIDNLCHFYWDIAKAERTQQMIDALLSSASQTVKGLEKNNENTNQILELQNHLRLQILNSMATQEQMSQIINNSSLTITSLTSQISSSLSKIHQDIDQHYAIVTRILSAVNQVLGHLDSLQLYLVAEVRSLQGVLFFVALMIGVLVGCVVSERVRLRKNQCFILISTHFLLEFFFASYINSTVGVQPMRCVSIILLVILVASARSAKNQVEQALSTHLSSERMRRIMEKAVRKQILELQLKNEPPPAAP